MAGKIPGYVNGSADDGWDGGDDNVGDNPTGRPRKSSKRTRGKKMRRLFKGTQWDPGKDSKGK